jgi:hypothetical protein
MLLGILPFSAFAADNDPGFAQWGEGDTIDSALSKLKVAFDDYRLEWLALPTLGVVKLRYTYFLYKNTRTGQVEEHPVYCIDPTKGGANEIVNNIGTNPDDGSNTATYIRSDKVGDTRYMAILRAGYPHQQFTSLGLESKEEGYYATKLALWMYIRGNDPDTLTINPDFGNSDPVANRVRVAAINIFNDSVTRSVPDPSLTLTGKPSSTAVLEGDYYVQGIEVHASGYIGLDPSGSGDVTLSWSSQPPAGTIVLGTDGEDITNSLSVKMSGREGQAGLFGTVTIKYPADGIDVETFVPPTITAEAILPNSEIYTAYAEAGQSTYQRYLVERDPKINLTATFGSQVEWEPGETTFDEGSMRIRKLQSGTLKPLAGAVLRYSTRKANGFFLLRLMRTERLIFR